MSTFQTAKTIGENALSTIGAFPASMSAPDPGELKKALKWLEMILNTQVGIRPTPGFWKLIDIPLEAGVGDYDLADYLDGTLAQQVFSVSILTTGQDPDPIDMLFESEAMNEDLTETGRPDRCVVTRDIFPIIKVYPMPVQSNQDNGDTLRVRLQTYQKSIDYAGTGDNDVMLRPSWYLWITKKLAYELGSGPVRKVGTEELDRLSKDADKLEANLTGRDGQFNTGAPPVTLPMRGA